MFFLPPSQKRLLSSLNPLAILAVAFFLIVLRTTASPLVPTFFHRWDLLLPFMVFFGQRRALSEGLILALFASHLYSLCSSAPIGVFTTYYLTLFLASRLMSYAIYASSGWSVFVLIFLLTIASRFWLGAVSAFFGQPWSVLSWQNLHPVGIFVTSTLGIVLYWMLTLVDLITFKVPKTSIEFSGDGT